MNHEADTDRIANDIASLLQSLSIGDNARDGDDKSAMIPEASASVDVANGVTTTLQSLDVPDDASVDVANDLTTRLQSLDVADYGNERDHVLEPKHKIFLSHSGAQKSFVADLCADLMRRDRHPFFDKLRTSLPIGEKFPSRIFDAIKQCKVGVVVLSEEFFTRTKWPMLELVAMVEESKKPNRRIKIIPVFYGISRDKCRDPDVQSKWMTEHWKKWEEEDKRRIDVEKWKSALGMFGSATGLVRKNGMLDRELRTEIVEAVCKEVMSETRWDDSGVEGKTRLCEDICEKVYQALQPKDLKVGVRVVGLHGMGGIGKTTACKVLCNHLSTDYCDKVCHVEFGSIKEVKLLRKALKVLSNLDVERLKNSDVDMCHGYLKNHIVKERVFLALDNVSDESREQAKPYLKANFGDGSVVLATARSVDQLLRLGVHKDDCFAMPELELEEAKSLFLGHAGLKKNEVDQDLLEKCVKRCYFSKGGSSSSADGKHYHPLALKVLGSEVGDSIRHDMTRQGALLTRIHTFNLSRQKEHPVFSILRSSFDSLREEDQLLFLDVALFLPPYNPTDNKTWPRKISYRALEWLGMVHGVKTDEIELRLECLKRRSLLETFGDRVGDFSMHDLWREFAEAEVKDGKLADRRFLWEGEYCVSDRVDLTGFPKVGVVKLCEKEGWREMSSNIQLDVRGLKHLKSLEVTFPQGVPSFVLKVTGLGTLENLTYLECHNVACIADLGWLTNLQVVVLRYFQGDKLPDMSKLTKLRILDLWGSDSLQSINLRNLTSLTKLFIYGCDSVQSVHISGCRSMTDLWGLSELNILEDFKVSFCPLFQMSPELWGSWKLRKLDITGCSSIKKLYYLGSFAFLEELNVSTCPLLRKLRGLSELRRLRKLDITGCSSIIKLDDLDLMERGALEELRAMECQSLATLPICRLPKLRVLDIEPRKVPTGFEWELGLFRKPMRRFKKQ